MVEPLPSCRSRLTGNVRGRPRLFFRSLILEVEVADEELGGWDRSGRPYPGATLAGCNYQEWRERESARIATLWQVVRYRWRDATWRDQLALARQDAESHGAAPHGK